MRINYYILILKTVFIIGIAAGLPAAYGQYVTVDANSYCDTPANYYNQYCNNNNYNNYNQYTPPQPSYYPYNNNYPYYNNFYPYYFPGNVIIQNGNGFAPGENFQDEDHEHVLQNGHDMQGRH